MGEQVWPYCAKGGHMARPREKEEGVRGQRKGIKGDIVNSGPSKKRKESLTVFVDQTRPAVRKARCVCWPSASNTECIQS